MFGKGTVVSCCYANEQHSISVHVRVEYFWIWSHSLIIFCFLAKSNLFKHKAPSEAWRPWSHIFWQAFRGLIHSRTKSKSAPQSKYHLLCLTIHVTPGINALAKTWMNALLGHEARCSDDQDSFFFFFGVGGSRIAKILLSHCLVAPVNI